MEEGEKDTVDGNDTANSRSRIMIPGVGGMVADLPQSHMFTTIDTQKKQFGIWVKDQAVPIQALPLITPQNKLDILIQLDHKVNIFLRMLLNDQTVKFLIHCMDCIYCRCRE